MSNARLPANICTLLAAYYTCEVTTVNRKGQPITWPCLPYFHQETEQIVLSASIAFPVKALNARRHPQVSLLYSDATGSQLDSPPALLVQGTATVKELLDYDDPLVVGLFRVSQKRQPDSERFTANRFSRQIFSWYLFQRLLIIVTPERLLLWPEGNFQAQPESIEVSHVE